MRWITSVLVVLVLVAGLWWWQQQRQAELMPEPDAGIPAEPLQPQPRHPLPKPEAPPAPASDERAGAGLETESEVPPEPEPPMPDLAESDDLALGALSDLLGADFTQQWVKPEFIVPRTVAVISSLDGGAPAMKTRPLQALGVELHTESVEGKETLLLSEANAERYDTLVHTLKSVPPERAAALYGRYYPLFQQAWEELGENEPYFNDRLIDVIDHLIATPEVDLPLEVVPHEGRLHFADEALEEASWGRKAFFRMGATHGESVKDWLRDFRAALTREANDADDTARPD